MTQIDKLKEVLEVALLTSSQPLSIEDLTKFLSSFVSLDFLYLS